MIAVADGPSTKASANGGPKRSIVLASGGTGGHLFPAQALAEALRARGHTVHLMTDERSRTLVERFPAIGVYEIPSATITPRQPFKLARQLLRLARGYLKARARLKALRPAVVVGFGGYPSVPPLLSAAHLRMKVCLHEQNAVMGRANRFIAPRAAKIATAFPKVLHLPPRCADRVVLVGNPVREAVRRLAGSPYRAAPADGRFRLLVFGGSQGARVFSQVVPPALAWQPRAVRQRLVVVQQCHQEDVEALRRQYEEAGIEAELKTFYDDLADRIAASHLVIARAGASTVSELATIGRPSILVPLPHSLDNDQLMNARALADAGGAYLLEQHLFSSDRLAALLLHLRYDDEGLENVARCAGAFARPDAADRLADLVEEMAGAGAG